MTFISGKYYRNSLRLRDYDYSQNGMCFITICTHQMRCLFGRIKNRETYLNDAGKIVNQYWQEIPKHYPFVILGRYIIMPNHIHGIIQINHPVGAGLSRPLTKIGRENRVGNAIGRENRAPTETNITLGKMVAFFKYQTTKKINEWQKNTTIPKIFQRNYYEHIIQDKFDLERIQEYIKNNPTNWENDRNNPKQSKKAG